LKSGKIEAANSKAHKTPQRSEALSYDEELHNGFGDDDNGSELDKESISKRALILKVTLTLRKLSYWMKILIIIKGITPKQILTQRGLRYR